jgi:DNA-binding MarR family transcriptional regulator
MSGIASTTDTDLEGTSDQQLDGCYEDAWQSIRSTHQILSDRIGQELAEAGLPELAWHDVLARLNESADPLRPKDLLCRVGMTKSGLTRLLDRIESAGMIERRSCPSDRRGTWLTMTDEGTKTLAAMKPIRDRAFASHFVGEVTAWEARDLAGVLNRVSASVLGELEGEDCCEL